MITRIGFLLVLGWSVQCAHPNTVGSERVSDTRCFQVHDPVDSAILYRELVPDRPVMFLDSSIYLPGFNQFDTIYWYRGLDSWGAFDQLCAVYQSGNGWKGDLIVKQGNSGETYARNTYSIEQEQLKQIRAMMDSCRIYCLPFMVDTIGTENIGSYTDSPEFYFIVKEGKHSWWYHWGPRLMDKELNAPIKDIQRVICCMLPKEHVNWPDLTYVLENVSKDSVGLSLHVTGPFLEKDIAISYDDETLRQPDGAFPRVLHKRDIGRIKHVYVRVTLMNGRVLPVQEVKSGK